MGGPSGAPALPYVRMEEPPVEGPARAAVKIVGAQQVVGRSQAAGRQADGPAKKGIHERVHGAGPPAGRSRGRKREIGDEPEGTGGRCAGQAGDDGGELRGRKTVEKEARRDRVKRGVGFPREHVMVTPADPRGGGAISYNAPSTR